MQIAAYVRVSIDDQNEQRQMRAIRETYEGQQDNQIDWYCDLGESGASTSRREYQRLRENIAEYDVVVAHELDRLGRSFADLAGFVEDLCENMLLLTASHKGSVNNPLCTSRTQTSIVIEDLYHSDLLLIVV
jgi:DNA invertase Pin-like site-specific DNA recombinase